MDGSVDAMERTTQLEQAMLETADLARSGEKTEEFGGARDSYLQQLARERRELKTNALLDQHSRAEETKRICKLIQKHVRKKVRAAKFDNIENILTTFRNLKDIAGIKSRKSPQKIEYMVDAGGRRIEDRTAIANVFAQFYGELYTSRATPNEAGLPDFSGGTPLSPFTYDELCDAQRKMKRGRAKDDAGIVAEMLKDGSKKLLQMTLEIFNDILSLKNAPPDSWKNTRLVVIFKKCNPSLPKNYRPIAILSVLYKLFARMVCSQLTATIIGKQGVEQAAYRKGYSTEEHLLTSTLIIEKSWEFNIPLWITMVDFEKAFDTVEHDALWQVLEKQ